MDADRTICIAPSREVQVLFEAVRGLGFALPITAPHVLWVNMVTSVVLGLVTAFEPHEFDVMRRAPRTVDRSIQTGIGIWRVIFVGLALLGNRYLPMVRLPDTPVILVRAVRLMATGRPRDMGTAPSRIWRRTEPIKRNLHCLPMRRKKLNENLSLANSEHSPRKR